MLAQDLLLPAGTAVAAGGAAILVAMAVRARRRNAVASEIATEFAIVADDPVVQVPVRDMDATPSVSFQVVEEPQLVAVANPSPRDAPTSPRGFTAPRGTMQLPPILRQTREAAAPPPPPVPTEWARRQVGPAPAGRTKGACSGCGSMLSVSNQRPLRIACPVCGRSRLLA